MSPLITPYIIPYMIPNISALFRNLEFRAQLIRILKVTKVQAVQGLGFGGFWSDKCCLVIPNPYSPTEVDRMGSNISHILSSQEGLYIRNLLQSPTLAASQTFRNTREIALLVDLAWLQAGRGEVWVSAKNQT